MPRADLGALRALGWSDELGHAWEAMAEPPDLPGRVARVDRGGWVSVQTGSGDERRARMHPRFRRLMDPLAAPTVGDWVVLRPDEGGGPTLAIEVLPRRSAFVRSAGDDSDSRIQVVAANVDTAMVLVPLDGDRNRRRTDRLLSLAWSSRAAPVLVLTKADACPDVSSAVEDATAEVRGVPVHVISAVTGDGVGELAPYCTTGQTIVLVGTSGAGKSTLANRLYGEEILETRGLRADGQGRHTTTHRQLLRLPDGGLLIDTPGLRSIGVREADEEAGEDRAFADVEALVSACRFSDCVHGGEPDCAVRAALEAGELSAARWDSYRTLETERAALAERREAAERAAETRRSRAARQRGRRSRH
jgi:ribosome biogenesis GTPase / thiamine phosphate phosphatase